MGFMFSGAKYRPFISHNPQGLSLLNSLILILIIKLKCEFIMFNCMVKNPYLYLKKNIPKYGQKRAKK